jgi:hypothetical protein
MWGAKLTGYGDNEVMPAGWEAERLVAEVRALAVRGLPRDDYHRELAARLRRRIAIDATCRHGVDPRTLLLTSAMPEELLEYGFLSTETFRSPPEPLTPASTNATTTTPSPPSLADGHRSASLVTPPVDDPSAAPGTASSSSLAARPLKCGLCLYSWSRLGLRRAAPIPSDRRLPASGRPADGAAFPADRRRLANVPAC